MAFRGMQHTAITEDNQHARSHRGRASGKSVSAPSHCMTEAGVYRTVSHPAFSQNMHESSAPCASHKMLPTLTRIKDGNVQIAANAVFCLLKRCHWRQGAHCGLGVVSWVRPSSLSPERMADLLK